MFRCGFFNCVIPRIDQWLGELFIAEKTTPSELKQMDYSELKYWHGWLQVELRQRERERARLEREQAKR